LGLLLLTAGPYLLVRVGRALSRLARPDRISEGVEAGNVRVSYPPGVGDELPGRLARYLAL
jgi:hypothetical protein